MKKLWIGIGVGIVVAGIATFVFVRKQNSYEQVHPKRGPITEAIYGIGTVTSRNIYQVKVGVTAALRNIYVTEGDEVKKGAPLVQLEDATLIRAPFDGTITSKVYNIGEIAFPQTPIMTLTDLKDLYLLVSLEQEGALRVKRGQKVRLGFESLRGEKFEGKVARVYPNEGQFLVQIEVKNMNPQILPGMTADAAIEVGRNEDALLIPVMGLSNGLLSIVRDGKAQKIEVKIGSLDNEWAEVTSGEVKTTDVILIPKKK